MMVRKPSQSLTKVKFLPHTQYGGPAHSLTMWSSHFVVSPRLHREEEVAGENQLWALWLQQRLGPPFSLLMITPKLAHLLLEWYTIDWITPEETIRTHVSLKTITVSKLTSPNEFHTQKRGTRVTSTSAPPKSPFTAEPEVSCSRSSSKVHRYNKYGVTLPTSVAHSFGNLH